MPNYEYRCHACGNHFERVVPVDARDHQGCADCGLEMERMFAAPSVMNVALPDGTRRFDTVRRYRAAEDAMRKEKDKTQKAKLQKDMDRLTGKAS